MTPGSLKAILSADGYKPAIILDLQERLNWDSKLPEDHLYSEKSGQSQIKYI
jgi:hypothetical protein